MICLIVDWCSGDKMNNAICKTYIGPDVNGRQVSGIIRHVAHHAKGTQIPIDYVLQCYNEGRSKGTAIISAEQVKAHMAGLDLMASMDAE